MNQRFQFYASCPPGTEAVLAQELKDLGIEAHAAHAGASFEGELEAGYRVCLWSRVASRVLLNMARFPGANAEALYDGVRGVDWSEHLSATGSFKVSAVLAHSSLDHSLFVVQKVKDAMVDQFRDRFGTRPSVDRDDPDVRVHCYLFRDQAWLSVDLSGESLHRRGYRGQTTAAPLKENLAAAVLYSAQWPDIASGGGGFVDPLCGAGALPIEAALMAFDIAPGVLRPSFGFTRWVGHDAALWAGLVREAEDRRQEGLSRNVSIMGSDADPKAIEAARANAGNAGVGDRIDFRVCPLVEAKTPVQSGLIVCNPPYGERIGAEEGLGAFYVELGKALREQFATLHAAVLTGAAHLQHRMRLTPDRVQSLKNGPLDLKLYHFAPRARRSSHRRGTASQNGSGRSAATALTDRLSKNIKRLARWKRDQNIHCYRIYDADIPEYAFAVDVYEAEGTWALMQEYAPPSTVAKEKAETRLRDGRSGIAQVLDLPESRVIVKLRHRQGVAGQYERLSERGQFMQVEEGGLKFLINLEAYLDTGLFLDQRLVRQQLRAMAAARRFLNLFGYTATATVYAASGSASSSVTVDRSNTYLDWAERNMQLNGFADARHQLVRVDCMEWLREKGRAGTERFGLIFADPPTFSNSKGAEQDFDVQRDHLALIQNAMRLLESDGALIFSVHSRRFKLDQAGLSRFRIKDITAATIPPDFARDPRIHYCWRFSH